MKKQDQISRFRHFNRFYTNYLGLLSNSLYDSSVTLTEARVLYELDTRPGSPARELMRRLNLDKGYLSRLLKRLANLGWVAEKSSEQDARVKDLKLTDKGALLMERLHTKAAAQAEEALAHLSADDRKQVLSAMSVIEKFLS